MNNKLLVLVNYSDLSNVGKGMLYGLPLFFEQIGRLAAIGLGIALLYSLARNRLNPVVAVRNTLMGLFEGLKEVLFLPLGYRRIYAIAKLCFKEALRRRILYVFVLFLAPFLFAGWYLPNLADGQVLFLVAFVDGEITWLLLPLVVFLTSMSLPNDLKNKTIHTVVTKPVHRLEIIVGRVLGFVAIYTIVLAFMGIISLVFLRGSVSSGETRSRHWTARVPVFARAPSDPKMQERGIRTPMMFEKDNKLQMEGTNVGRESVRRSHIQGATGDSAHWFFEFDPAKFSPDHDLRMLVRFNVFKTTKGDPSRDVGPNAQASGIHCLLTVFDPTDGAEKYSSTFRVDNDRLLELNNVPYDACKNGRMEVVASCLTPNQFIGMAPDDLYFLAAENSFEANFLKGLFSIWLKVVLLTSVAVSASTVLNGFVTILFTTMVYVLGVCYPFMLKVIHGELKGGGPIESFMRLYRQMNQVSELDANLATRTMQLVDGEILAALAAVGRIIPDLGVLDTAWLVADGIDVPAGLILANAARVLLYVIPVMIVGYFLLRNREIAA